MLPDILPALCSLFHNTSGSKSATSQWMVTFTAGSSIPLSSDLPLNIALAPDGIHAAITNNGNGLQCIDLVNLKENKVVFTKVVKDAWLGLAFSKN